jgi:hypothetical protein
MNIYLQTSFGDYLYISYFGLNMEVVSSIDDINKILTGIDPAKRKIKASGSSSLYYSYFLGADYKAKLFVKRMKGELVEEEKPKQIIDFGNAKEEEAPINIDEPKQEDNPQRIIIE